MTILDTLYALPIADEIRKSLFLFPMIESAHVIALTLVFGTIAIVDLRLLGVASGHRPFTRLAPEILKWTWVFFALAVITGSLMFVSNAVTYFENTAFRIKMILMLLAGINMAVFQILTHRSVHLWDDQPKASAAGRAAAILSICLWIGVIGAGRVIGFTSTQKAEKVEPPADVNFDDFLSGGPGGPPPPADVTAPAQ
jgi:hypothetical protein